MDRSTTVLHLSDLQFGLHHRFGRLGLPSTDEDFDTLLHRLGEDLRGLEERHGLVPDLLVLTGDLAEWGKAIHHTLTPTLLPRTRSAGADAPSTSPSEAW